MNLLDCIVRIAYQAGDKILEIYGSGQENIQKKLDHSPVTDADLFADALIRDGILNLPSDYFLEEKSFPLVTEETIVDPVDTIQTIINNRFAWIIDPLDGTRDFIAHTGDFAVCIALIEKGSPILGVIHCPVHGITVGAVQNQGAFLFSRTHKLGLPIREKQLFCRPLPQDQFVLLTSRFRPGSVAAKIQEVFPQCQFQEAGSAYKYALIALGRADLSVRRAPTSLWDLAAAHCILNECGGGMVDFQGNPLTYNHGSLLNPPFIAHGAFGSKQQDFLGKVMGILRSFETP